MKDNQDKLTWDDIWEKRGDTISDKDVFRIMDEIKWEYLQKYLPSPSESVKIIEVGCGSARLSSYLSLQGYNITCLDYSEKALQVARKNFKLIEKEADFIQADVRNIPLPDNSFDVVISTGLLEHFPEPLTVIKEMVRIIKPGGIFYSDIVPLKFSLLRSSELFMEKLGLKSPEGYYEKEMNIQDIKNLLLEAELEKTTVFPAGIFPPPLPFSWKIRYIKQFEYKFLSRTKNTLRSLDGGWLADKLGFYYFAIGHKSKVELI